MSSDTLFRYSPASSSSYKLDQRIGKPSPDYNTNIITWKTITRTTLDYREHGYRYEDSESIGLSTPR
jgi:hypothetical protein